MLENPLEALDLFHNTQPFALQPNKSNLVHAASAILSGAFYATWTLHLEVNSWLDEASLPFSIPFRVVFRVFRLHMGSILKSPKEPRWYLPRVETRATVSDRQRR